MLFLYLNEIYSWKSDYSFWNLLKPFEYQCLYSIKSLIQMMISPWYKASLVQRLAWKMKHFSCIAQVVLIKQKHLKRLRQMWAFKFWYWMNRIDEKKYYQCLFSRSRKISRICRFKRRKLRLIFIIFFRFYPFIKMRGHYTSSERWLIGYSAAIAESTDAWDDQDIKKQMQEQQRK